jgi:hypothetical protein
MTLKSSKSYGNDSTTEKPFDWEQTLVKNEREERKGTSMDHMTYMTTLQLTSSWEEKGAAYQTQNPVRERRYPMTCLRCDRLMVHEKFEDLDGLWSSDHEFTGWRCLNCGAIVDPVIAAHKRITSSVVASIQSLISKHEAPSSWTDRLADHLTVQKRRVCHD